MNLFTASGQQAEINAYLNELKSLEDQLDPLAPKEDLAAIQALRGKFSRQVDEFFRENRLLNIGVVGQVKAGKSSFLNTMLFEGRQVLPKASTPKTAALTKIEYSPQNRLEVRYLSAADWSEVEEDARYDQEAGEDSAAQELVKMVAQRRALGLVPTEKLGRTEVIECQSVAQLQGILNQYVGEDGLYTPLVESVTLYMDREELKELSIVDTPGLNDPVTSRTDQAKKFLEVCDVVFFLSQSGSFLDSNDWILLSEQLPCQGVKRMILVASKADSALMDILHAGRRPSGSDPLGGGLLSRRSSPPKKITLGDAMIKVREKLEKRAQSEVEHYGRNMGTENPVYQVLRGCQHPYPVSAMVENMRQKSRDRYDREEKNIDRQLSPYLKDRTKDMERIGNFSAVRETFLHSAQEKEAILLQKERELIPTARMQYHSQLTLLRNRAIRRKDILAQGDLDTMERRLSYIQKQGSTLRTRVDRIFSGAMDGLEEAKKAGIDEIHRLQKDKLQLSEHTGSEEHTKTYVTYRHHFLFFRWGKEINYYTYTTSYQYLLAADAAEQLRLYGAQIASGFERVFQDAIHQESLRAELLNAVVASIDASDDSYDAAFCRQIAEETIHSFSFPAPSISFEDQCREISSKFKGEIRSSSQQQSLTDFFEAAMKQALERAVQVLETESRNFRDQLKAAGGRFSDQILSNIEGEYQTLSQQLQDRQRQLEHTQKYLALLEKLLREGDNNGTTA